MARIVIANWAEKTLEVTDLSKTLLHHFHDNQLDWMHSCGGKGRCTTCKAIIVEGAENFIPVTAAEQRYRQLGALKTTERLSCQAKITGDVRINVPDEYMLPHIDYFKP
jgi:ferredoxin, 2Fe-2S